MTKREWQPTPHAILPLIAGLIKPAHTPLLDPCAGDGFTLDYLARKWSCARYGVEVDPNLYPSLKEYGKAINERFEDVYARGFALIYAYPPPDTKRPAGWIRNVAQSLSPRGIVIWRLTKEMLKRPKVIEIFTKFFEDWEFFRDPPGVWDNGHHYTVRCRLKDPEHQMSSMAQCVEFSRCLEEAAVLGEVLVEEWEPPYGRDLKFRQRGLEWEDVYPDLVECLKEIAVPGTGEKLEFTLEEDPDEIPDPSLVNSAHGQCWMPAYAAKNKRIYAMVLVGRKTSIYAIESQFKKGLTLEVKWSRYKAIGGATGAKEDYIVIADTLPNTGAFVHVWIHIQCTKRANKGGLVFVSEEDDAQAAKIVSNALGIPVAPEWMDIVSSSAGHQYGMISNMTGRFLALHKEKIMTALGEEARNKELPTPTPIRPEQIRPIMPPSVGIWAQLAMQEFINEIPLPGGLIMHAEQIVIKDIDSEEAIDGVIEKTTIERKDAVRITVFHFEGDDAGEWEIFETERMEDDTNGNTPTPSGNNQTTNQQQTGGHTVAAVDLAKHLSGT